MRGKKGKKFTPFRAAGGDIRVCLLLDRRATSRLQSCPAQMGSIGERLYRHQMSLANQIFLLSRSNYRVIYQNKQGGNAGPSLLQVFTKTGLICSRSTNDLMNPD
jgi:hypothetical protein